MREILRELQHESQDLTPVPPSLSGTHLVLTQVHNEEASALALGGHFVPLSLRPLGDSGPAAATSR